jgi:EpsI family protein
MDRRKIATILALTVTILVGAASYTLRARQSHPDLINVQFEALPLEFGPYVGREARFDSATYVVLGADTTTLRQYVDPAGDHVWLFVAYFGEQNYGQQIHSPQNCLPGGGWRIESVNHLQITVPGVGALPVSRLLIEARGKREVMYYFFLTRAGYVADEFRLKFRLAQAALTFKRRDGAFIRVTTAIGEGDAAAADARAVAFLQNALPSLLAGMHF